DINLDEAVGNSELGEREAHLVAIARSLHGIERIHRLPSGGAPPPCPRRLSPSRRQCHDAIGLRRVVADYRGCEPQFTSPAAPVRRRKSFRRHSAATRWARACATRASSSTGTIGAKSRCAIHSGRVNLVMWLETAHSVRYTILRG